MDESAPGGVSCKRVCAEELKQILSRIETAQKLMPEREDWGALEAAVASRREELAACEALLRGDAQRRLEAGGMRREELQAELGRLQRSLDERVSLVREMAAAAYRAATDKAHEEAESLREEKRRGCSELQAQADARRDAIEGVLRREYAAACAHVSGAASAAAAKRQEVKDLSDDRQREESRISDLRLALGSTSASIGERESELSACRGEWHAIHAERLVTDASALVCPACGRRLEGTAADARREELTASFNARRAERVKASTERGKSLKERIAKLHEEEARQQAER